MGKNNNNNINIDGGCCSQPYYAPLKVLWDYLRRPSALRPAECIVGFGNYNGDIALRAAELYHAGYSKNVLFSGGLGRNTLGLQQTTEADSFTAIAIQNGVPEKNILVENRSTNTAENITFTRELLSANGISPRCLIAVHQPFMERRIAAAFDVYWPDVELLTTSYEADIPAFFARAANYGIDEHTVIEEAVGDFQRMELYADRGWQSRQPIPPEVRDAYLELIALGYDGQLST